MNMDSDWMETQISNTKTLLMNRGFPRSVWDYYLTTPREWRKDDMDPIGVHNGVIAVLTSRGSVSPWWIPAAHVGEKVKLSTNFKKVMQVLDEVNRFKDKSMPDDSQLNAEYNRAEERANKLHEKLQEACNDLSEIAYCADQTNYEFYGFILDFVDKVKLNGEIQKANIIYGKQLNYLSEYNATEEHSREKQMKVLESEKEVQQKENSYKPSKRMDIDDANGDMITEDSSTNKPSVILSKEIPRREIVGAVVKTRHEVNSYNKDSKLPEDLDSEETYEEKDITIDIMSTMAEVVTGIEDTNKGAVTGNRKTACDDNIENSRNYYEDFLNDQINEFDIKDRVKAEIETQKESKEVSFKEKKSSVYRCSDCEFTTNYLQDLKYHTESIHEGLKKFACNAHDHVPYYNQLVQSRQKTKLKDKSDRAKRIGCEACTKNLPHKRCRVNSLKQSTSSWRKKKRKLKRDSSNMNNCEKSDHDFEK